MEAFLRSSPKLAEVAGTLAPRTTADAATVTTVALVAAAFLLREYTWDRPDQYRHLWYERPQDDGGLGPAKQRATRNIARRLEELNKDAVVFWGSQSGTAESLGARLGRELQQRFHLDTLVADLSDFDPASIAEIPRHKVAVFVLSTYGDGDPSDNAAEFFDWFRRQAMDKANSHARPLGSLRYAAFGLGNSHYQHYNRIVDVVTEALQQLGAERLLDTGKADDALGTTEEDYVSWKEVLFSRLCQDLHLQEHPVTYEPVLSVIPDSSLEPIDLYIDEPVHSSDSRSSTNKNTPNTPIHYLPIRSARQLCSSSVSSPSEAQSGCLHMDIDLADHPQLRYKTGDHLAIWPTNPAQEVKRLLDMLDLSEQGKRDQPLLIKSLDPTVKVKVPTPTTIDALLRHHLEICAPVPRDTIRRLAEFAPTTRARDFLLDVGRRKDAYLAFTSVTHVTLGRLLEHALTMGADAAAHGEPAAAWTRLPLSFVLEALPRLQPRYYSISSSSIVSPRMPSLTVGISSTRLMTETQTPVEIPGLATGFLRDKATLLEQGPVSVFAHVRQSKFKLPALASTPLVMVAAGTGLAPFRAFIQERLRLHNIDNGGNSKPVGRMMLFFGCQSPERDYLYGDEMLEMQRQLGDKLSIVTAFSRAGDPAADDGDDKVSLPRGKTYVQHRIAEHADAVAEMLSDGASLYICGRASMAREVGKAVTSAVASSKRWDAQEPRAWLQGLKRSRKWQEDVWG
ncbi:NADPH--cytochrome P450 reductase [Emericellopsis cladophorae]|uniref:NADPH--hemoprotein reductase n=1 Tax=Emericellopsis cladophorae TaxID=2686198 RepID=A0A9Q0BBL0_9HYPO|nr:NADPH--cytochrome P450 reductase [Emericellopsis cladophorae]KAI6778610.1 NADPH--cytochrome P450 reductase [Emericellopsis cladophorae]